MTIIAIVIRVNPRNLLVRDVENNEEILVHFRNANRFNTGDRVRITFNGQKTLSIPPQITATSIIRISGPVPAPPKPARMRALVLQTGRNFLLVWDLHENRLVRVEFAHFNRFRVGQQVFIQYNTIILDNPPRITATQITLT